MFRDRTNLYISYRRTFPHHRGVFSSKADRFDGLKDEEEGLIQPYSDTGETEMVELPPSIVELQRNSELMLADIETKITELGKLYKKNLLPGFSDTTEDDAKIKELSFKITKSFQLMYSEIKTLDDSRLQFQKAAETEMVDNLKKSLAIRTQDLSTQFRSLQNSYIRYLKEDEFEVPLIDTKGGNKFVQTESSENIESYSRQALQESSQQLMSQQETISDEYLHQREEEIYKIAQGVIEISTIFKELENMVVDQGTVLDRIDYNLSKTVADVKGADKQMKKAEKYQKATAKCKLVFFLVLLILLFLMILIVKPKRVDHYYEPKPAQPNQPADQPADQPATPNTPNDDYDSLLAESG